MAKEHKVGGRGKNSLANKARRRLEREYKRKVAAEVIPTGVAEYNSKILRNLTYLHVHNLVQERPVEVSNEEAIIKAIRDVKKMVSND